MSGRIVGGLDDVTRLNEGRWTEGITRLYRWRMVLGVRCAKEGDAALDLMVGFLRILLVRF